jgi:sec-independent protein translocase protein TatC
LLVRRRGSDPGGEMSLADHLRELRNRLIKSGIALAIAAVVCYIEWKPLFNFLSRPYCSIAVGQQHGCQLYTFQPLDQFLIRLRVSLMAAAVVSSPIWLYQLGAFITPGLKRKEKRYAGGFLAASLSLFLVGVVFAYLTIDRGLAFLLDIGGSRIEPLLGVTPYLNFVTLTLVAFGTAFEFPVVVVFLNLVGVLTTDRMRAWRRGMIFGLFVFAALITPSQDPFTFTFMAIPLCLLYEVCIIIGRLRDRSRRRQQAQDGLAALADDEASRLPPPEPVLTTVETTSRAPANTGRGAAG